MFVCVWGFSVQNSFVMGGEFYVKCLVVKCYDVVTDIMLSAI